MWILQIPYIIVIFQALVVLGILVYVVSEILKLLPYTQLARPSAVLVLAIGLYFIGANTNEQRWKQRAAELQHKVELAEARGDYVNRELQAALAAKSKTITEKVYVNKEVIREVAGPQIDATCTLPVSSVVLHNAAAQAEVASGPGSVDGSPSGVAPSKLLETVVENYGSCQENAARLRGWQEWYRAQKQIYESLP